MKPKNLPDRAKHKHPYREKTRNAYPPEDFASGSSRIADILESIQDGFFAIDHEWRFAFVNQRAAKNVGLNAEDLIGRNLWEEFPRIRGTEHEARYRRAMEDHEIQRFEMHGVLTDRWYRITAYPSHDGISVYWQDITEQKKAQEELQRSRAQLEAELEDTKLLQEVSAEFLSENNIQALYEKIIDAAVRIMHSDYASMQMLHPERGGKGELQLLAFRGFSPEAARFWEWVGVDSKGSTCGMALRTGRRVITPDVEKCGFMQGTDDLAVFLETGIHACQTTPLISRGGRMVGMISTHWGNPHDPSERDLRLLDILARQAADLIERMCAQEELRRHRESLEVLVRERTAELEEKNEELKEEMAEREKAEEEKRKVEAQLAQANRIEAIDRFAGGIAHDMNNILYPIIVNIEQLLNEEPEDSIRRGILDQTLRAAYRQRDLIRKILSFSMRNERILRPVRIVPLLEEVLDFVKSTLPSTISIQRNISVHADVIMGDPTQIQQVFMNLCQNAADALGSRKGTIGIGLTNVRMEPAYAHHDMQAGDYIKLTVKDTGCGMKPEVMSRIFEPFFTGKDAGNGTGMGLAVVHGIIKGHKGTITVESEERRGSLFTVFLPLSDAQCQDQTAHTDSTPLMQGKERILLIDDEEIILSSLQRALGLSGYRVVTFKDSQEALDLFAGKPDEFDLVITDLTMPGMTGLELAGKLLRVRPDIPIILCTGYNDAVSQQEARSAGIRELIQKPVGTSELRKIILRVLKNRHDDTA